MAHFGRLCYTPVYICRKFISITMKKPDTNKDLPELLPDKTLDKVKKELKKKKVQIDILKKIIENNQH